MATQSYLEEKLATNALVYVEGKKVKFDSLVLDQAFGQHHTFQIKMDYDSMDQEFMSNSLEQMNLIGKIVDIELLQGNDSANAYEFKGVISDVSNEGEDGKHGYLILQGYGTTVLLERGKRMDVFSEMTLQEVFKEVTDGVINKRLSCVNSPVYTGKVSFLMQYNESDWLFLQRLSAISGETLFYTGRDLVFGQYNDWDPMEVTYDKEITQFRSGARLLANNFTGYQYLSDNDDMLTQDAPERIEDANDYVNTAALRSKELTEKRPVKVPVLLNVEDKGSLDELVKRNKVTTASRTVYVEGKAKTCAPRIGRLLTIRMPGNMPGASNLGTYRIIKVRHVIDQGSRYHCEFEGIPSALKFFPVPQLQMPLIGPLLGQVVKNNDPQGQGRVCVEFPFATNRASETWMRVMSLSAGSSNEVGKNRGMVFVPEEGDQVIVDFEYGDPNRPFVKGSMFHGKNTIGGQDDNHIKSIITRSGHTLEFDDAKESLGITVKDKNGNFLHLDTKGNNIEITALETITFKAKDIKMEASNNIEMQAEAAIKADAMDIIHIGAQGNVDIVTESDMQIKSMASTSLVAQTEMKIEGQATKINSASSMEITGVDTSIKGQMTKVSGAGHKIEIM
ncbi:type VI secretion system Vgr family protein [Dysgonomonas sp. HGC4]|uniref:type VI secretion system Vgr family protein n=1 Tax=Dysgonomonas sp. HGC4 TaxID=1658009 RepID=UPI000681D054|nr:phage baseplate assembly protein V [Dysgonomonas sp. HGC4]MBD8347644.1 hypothetical protein [Dysgonomonas sp. HGC4]